MIFARSTHAIGFHRRERCIGYPVYRFVMAYGVSNKLRSRWDNTNARFLGNKPVDNSEIDAAEILAGGEVKNQIPAQFHGGFSTPMESDGNPSNFD